MKFTKQFHGVKDGDIYPTQFEPGEECPRELEAAAHEAGALDAEPRRKKAKAEAAE